MAHPEYLQESCDSWKSPNDEKGASIQDALFLDLISHCQFELCYPASFLIFILIL